MNKTKAISLGMKRINGAMKAEDSVMIIAERLLEFRVNFKEQIVVMVAGGAAVMVKTGRLSEVFHHICLSHSIQVYKKSNAGGHEVESFDCETIHIVTDSENWILMVMLK